MIVIINFNVRNAEWYWPADRMKESRGYYEEFKALNVNKIPRHPPTWAYQIGFDVNDVQENRNADYAFQYSDSQFPNVVQSTVLKDMTHVVFTGEGKKAEVAISNEIMHSFLGAKQSGRKYYWYFYIKSNAQYVRLTDVIWVSERQSLIFP